jgi:hypothetical protein
MVTGVYTVFSCATNFLNGRKCIFCGSFKTVKTTRGYVKCMLCGKQKSLTKLRREIGILQGFHQQQPAYRLASDLGLDAKTVTRVYQRLRIALFHTAELEGAKLSGKIELDESYFGGARKGQRGRGARGKKHRIRPAGAGWKGLHQSRGVGLGGDSDDSYSGAYPKGIGLLHRCVSWVSIAATIWKTYGG